MSGFVAPLRLLLLLLLSLLSTHVIKSHMLAVL
jgi:hypothetical protein